MNNTEENQKIKCPKKPEVEVIWRDVSCAGFPGHSCSFSGAENCKKCIKKGDYPK